MHHIKKIFKWPWTEIGVIFSIIMSLMTFLWGLSQYKETRRPYLGSESTYLDKEHNGFFSLLSLPLHNYGETPAFFTAEYSGYGKKEPFQGGNHIFPGQSMEVSWQTLFQDETISYYLGDPCEIVRNSNETITINYGSEENDLKYQLILKRKEIAIPEQSKLFADKKVISARCEEVEHAFVWHITYRN